jgi:hypothetical protein
MYLGGIRDLSLVSRSFVSPSGRPYLVEVLQQVHYPALDFIFS